MSMAIRAVVREGRIELLDKIVTPMDNEPEFWLKASETLEAQNEKV